MNKDLELSKCGYERRKLKVHPHANSEVIVYPNGFKYLISYNTVICSVCCGILMFHNDIDSGVYTQTTRKHISCFMREIGLDYSIAKKCFERGLTFNIFLKEYTKI